MLLPIWQLNKYRLLKILLKFKYLNCLLVLVDYAFKSQTVGREQYFN